MSFDKQYENRKDQRKPYYRGSKRLDRTCRCHGGCPYCESGRQHRDRKRIAAAEDRRV